MPEYLKNRLCKFKPLFKIDYSIRQNILSTCLFKIPKGYKDFSLYVEGLMEMSKFVEKFLPDFKIRIFIDENIYLDNDIYSCLSSKENIQPVLFECSKFKIGNYHDGLFGTLARFFPMFNFPNNDANIVCVNDADFIAESYLLLIPYLKEFIRKTINLYDVHFFFYGRLFHYANKEKEDLPFTFPYAVAWKVFNFKKIPYEVLMRYFELIEHSSEMTIFSDYYNNYSRKGVFDVAHKTKFIFGVDEYFLNNYLISFLFKENLCFAYRFYYQIHFPLFFALKKAENRPKLYKIFKFVLNQKENLTFEKMYNKIDRIVYFDFKNDKKITLDSSLWEINYRIYLAYAIMRKDKDYSIVSKKISDLFFSKKNFGCIRLERISYVGCLPNQDNNERELHLPLKYLKKLEEKIRELKIELTSS